MSFVARLRRVAANCLIAGILCVVLIDALPQAPPPLKDAVQPVTQRVGLAQPWNVFAPPDGVNTRLRAEITYRDGQTAVWRSPEWSEISLWRRFTGHRHEEFLDTAWGEEDEPVWQSWARHLARKMRPEDPNADRGATVRIIVAQSYVRQPELGPWTSWRVPPTFAKEEELVLTIRKLP